MENQKLLTFINKFKNSQEFAAKQVVAYLGNNSNAKIIEDYNRQQLSKGKDANNEDLGDYGELRTMQRIAAGKQVGFIDLKFEGTFHDSIYINPGLKNAKTPAIFFGSSDPKFDDIMKDDRFKSILGLNEENRYKVGYMIAYYVQVQLMKYYQV